MTAIWQFRLPLLGIFLLTLLITWGLSAGQEAPSTFDIIGSVVDAQTGLPVGGAEVRLRAAGNAFPRSEREPYRSIAPPGFGQAGPAYSTMSDPSGRFRLAEVAAGIYSIGVSKEGFGRTEFGRIPADSTSAADAQPIRLEIVHSVSIAGTIRDGSDLALTNMPVYVLEASVGPDGERNLLVVDQTLTDATGRYELSELAPGRYYVAAGNPLGPLAPAGVLAETNDTSYGLAYYPGVAVADLAGYIELLPGMRLSTLNLTLERAPVSHFIATVVPTVGQQLPSQATLRLARRLPFRVPTLECCEWRVPYDSTTGRFQLDGLVQGQYRLDATLDMNGTPVEIRKEITIGDSEETLRLPALSNIGRLDASVTIGSGTPLRGAVGFSPETEVLLTLKDPHGQYLSTSLRVPVESGRFTLEDVSPGLRQLTVNLLPSGYYVSDVLFNGSRIQPGLEYFVTIPEGAPSTLGIELQRDGGRIRARIMADSASDSGFSAMLLPKPLPPQLIYSTNRIFIADRDTGEVLIEGVPPGRHQLYAWVGSLGDIPGYGQMRRDEEMMTEVVVDAGATSVISIAIEVPEAR